MAQFGDFTVDRNSTKYVLGSGGTIISYATDEPAFEFNADGSYKGLLVEPAATNYDTASSTVLSWAALNTTKSYDQTTAPDGVASTADSVLEAAVTDVHTIYKDYTLAAGSYIFSCFVKSIGGRNFQFSISALGGGGSGGGQAQFNLSTGSIVSGTGTITEIGNGWYRVSGPAVTPGATGMRVIAYSINGTSSSFEGDTTKGFYMWGAQLETGPIATSYIPTSGSTVTRVKDDITQTGAQSLIGQTEGTLYVEVDWRATSGVSQYLLSVNDGSSVNRMLIYNQNDGTLRMVAIAGNDVKTIQGESSTGYSGIQKIAFAYAEDDFELYRNGSSISSDTTGSLAALGTMTDIDLGQNSSSTDQANMWIRAVALYPTRLSDAECEALTTL
jgi:hypothetical protein